MTLYVSGDVCLQSVIVKSIERNAANLYEARRRLLGEEGEAPPVVRTCPPLDATVSTSSALNIASLGEPESSSRRSW